MRHSYAPPIGERARRREGLSLCDPFDGENMSYHKTFKSESSTLSRRSVLGAFGAGIVAASSERAFAQPVAPPSTVTTPPHCPPLHNSTAEPYTGSVSSRTTSFSTRWTPSSVSCVVRAKSELCQLSPWL